MNTKELLLCTGQLCRHTELPMELILLLKAMAERLQEQEQQLNDLKENYEHNPRLRFICEPIKDYPQAGVARLAFPRG